jgi:hypothetical protein
MKRVSLLALMMPCVVAACNGDLKGDFGRPDGGAGGEAGGDVVGSVSSSGVGPHPPDCDDHDECTDDLFDSSLGACVITTIPACSLCVDDSGRTGTSRGGGLCCTGCWAGPDCQQEPNELACGARGGLCAPCVVAAHVCADGVCRYPTE